MAALKKIINTLRPYIPRKSAFIYKLPLILLANCLLEAMGKRSSTALNSPTIRCNTLNALFVDTETVYSLFEARQGLSQVERKMQITTLKEHPLTVSSVDDLENNYTVQKAIGEFVRSFHYSRPMIKKRRRLAFRKIKFKHKIEVSKLVNESVATQNLEEIGKQLNVDITQKSSLPTNTTPRRPAYIATTSCLTQEKRRKAAW
ncbi:hypothetical protein MAM1_0517c10815 [Mucor ambiguus]|uniref:Uncharacterized protein n=1 Tax=Mucor ambiguus TaxID=91626 RepID=A0A0C9MKF6_9FUNG|nr:hypothetical protein MAM1_0517c10815 [Mucor ambiguus]